MYCEIEQLHVDACDDLQQRCIEPDGMLLCGQVHGSGGAQAYPDLIDPVIQGAQLISVFVKDGLLQLLVLKQNLHVHAPLDLQHKHMHIYRRTDNQSCKRWLQVVTL